MATPREYLQSILQQLAPVQNATDELLATPGVVEILKDIDDLCSELTEVIE